MRLWGILLAMLAAAAVAGAASYDPIPVTGWRYTTTQPAPGWESPDFDASAWKQGVPGFGNQGLPAFQQSLVKTAWETPDIWVRAECTLDSIPEHPALRFSHDEDLEVYVNGVFAVRRAGYITDYAITPLKGEALKALRAGKNTIAAHCHQTIGGQFLDIQVVSMTVQPIRTVTSIIKELGAIPRPEHPRPDRFRPHWANLNGVWEFAFDDKDEGLRAGWSDGRALPRRIIVPFCPESNLSGIHDEELHTVCWYARTVDVPEALRGRRLLLHFGAVDYRTEAWLNGHRLGEHEGGYDPFEFDLTHHLRPTGNRLVIRVQDDHREDKPKGKQSIDPQGCVYMRTTGIWQTVWLEAVGPTFIRDWVADSDPETGVLRVDARLDGLAEGLRLAVTVTQAGKQVARGAARVHDDAARTSIRVMKPALWSPDSPSLYDVDLRLLTPARVEVDRVSTYVAFRKIETKDGMYHLNGRPFFLLSALDQGFYPDGLYTPRTDAVLREDVVWAKRYGLNSVRKHQIVAEPRFYYWCDKLGLTVWGEFPDWGDSLRNTSRFLEQWGACVRRDINHPCIITWVPTNERTGPDDDWLNATKVRIRDFTRALDPTRPVIDTSGYCHTQTDITDLHVNPPDGKDCRAWWDMWRKAIAATGNFPAYPERPTYCKGYRHAGQPVIFSETGNWRITECLPMGPWAAYGYGPVATVKDFLALYRDFFLALISEPDCAGFSYVQLYDVEGEVNGYLTYDRKPKMPAEVIAGIHQEGLRLRAERMGQK